MEMLRWLDFHNLPFKIIFTKTDKISNNEKFRLLKEIRKKIEFHNEDVFFYSSLSHKGREEVLQFMEDTLKEAGGNVDEGIE